MSRLSSLLTIKNLYLLLPFWFVGIFSFFTPVYMHDLGRFIQSGAYMLAHRTPMMREIFTHTYYGLEYINHGWLSHVILCAVFQAGGIELLVFFRALLALGIVFLLWRAARKILENSAAASLFVFYAAFLSTDFFQLRPQLLIMPFFIILLEALHEGVTLTTGRQISFFLMLVLWTNLHSSFTLAAILILCFLIGRIGDLIASGTNFRSVRTDPAVINLFRLLLILIAATLVNPYGPALWSGMASTVKRVPFRVSEWKPLAFGGFMGYRVFFSIIFSALIIKLSRKKIKSSDLLLLVSFLLMGLKSARMIPWWGFVSCLILAPHFHGSSLSQIPERFFSRHSENRFRESLLVNVLFSLFFLGSIILGIPWIRSSVSLSDKENIFLDPKVEPVEMVKYFETEAALPEGRMFNFIDWGSYLIWKLWPERRVFADNQFHIIPNDVWEDYLSIHSGFPDWEDLTDKYGVTLLILSRKKNSRLIKLAAE
ncbi:MAG TPA: hypothetical protein VJC03_01790, partial [bacterium]|nr:hypothetical protein [bacterium]